jgi:regulator of protease activity HflC (stomatin/prohibitin superfamily)
MRGTTSSRKGTAMAKQAEMKRRGRASRHRAEQRSQRDKVNAENAVRKARMEQRKTALRNVCEGYFVAHGWRIKDAAEMALLWVLDALEQAKLFVWRMGYDYTTMTWRAV